MQDASLLPKLKRAGCELGAKTTYQLFLENEQVPAIGIFHISLTPNLVDRLENHLAGFSERH